MTLLKLTPATSTHRGMRRKLNEDAVGYRYPDGVETLMQYGALFVVADGVGGLSAGDKASNMAVEQLTRRYYEADDKLPHEQRLALAVQQVNADIFKQLNKQAATTIAAVVIVGDELFAASVGDSLIFRIRGDEITQLNEEDVLHDASSEDGALTQAIGYRQEIDVQTIHGTIATSDQILICSDGITRYLKPQQLVRFAKFRDPRDGVRRLITEANSAGGADNISAILINIGEETTGADITDHIARLIVPVSIDSQPMFTPDVPSKPHTQVPRSGPEPNVPETPIPEAVLTRAETTQPDRVITQSRRPLPEPRQGAGNSNQLLIGGAVALLAIGALIVAFALGRGSTSDSTPTPEPTVAEIVPTNVPVPTVEPTSDTIDSVQINDRLVLSESQLTVARVGDNAVGSFIASAGTAYLVDNITEFEGQLWYRLLNETTNQTGWVAEADLADYQIQRDS